MSELQFPKNPTVGQEYDFAPYRYYWDGVKWKTKGIGYNPVNDLRDELEPKISDNESKVFEALRRSYADAGLNLVDGSFEEGGVLSVASDVMITASVLGYSWGGNFPHTVVPGTDPTAVGSGYIPRTDVLLRSELASAGGATIVGTASGKTVQESIAITPQVFVDIASVSGSDVLVGDHIYAGGVLYVIADSIPNGGVTSPDCHLIAPDKYAVKHSRGTSDRVGVYTTKPELGHRAGQLRYSKGASGAKLLTDLSRYKPNTIKDFAPTVAYVDLSKDGTGDGLSWDTAKKSIYAGIVLNPDILYVRGGLYARHLRMMSFSLTKDMAIIAVGGPVVQGSLATGAWTLAAGKTKTYALTYMSGLTGMTGNVIDTYVLNNGAPSLLSAVASIDIVEATPGSFYHSGTVTYVHAADDRDLTKYGDSLRLIQPVAGPIITWTGDYKLLLQGFECWYGGTGGSNNVGLVSNGTAYAGSSFYNIDCVFGGCRDGGGGNGLAVRDIGMCISERSSCVVNQRDGFNYHYGMVGGGNTTLAPHYIEIDCVANGNGLGSGSGNNQGSTAHENCVGFRINGDYSWQTDGGCIVDIDASKCHMVNVSCNHSGVVGALLSADPWAGAPGVTAEWWIDGMSLSGNPAIANARGDLAVDGYNSRLHYVDVMSDKPTSTRSFSVSPDDLV